MKNIIYISILLQILLSSKYTIKNNKTNQKQMIMDTIKRKKIDISYLKEKGKKTYYSKVKYGAIKVKKTDKWNLIHYELKEKKNDLYIHMEGDERSGFTKNVQHLLFSEFLRYDNKGILVNQKKESIYGFLIEEKEYKQGNIVKLIDYDNEFKFKWEKVKEYLNSIDVETTVASFIQYDSSKYMTKKEILD